MQTSDYKIPANASIGHVHLKVADLQRAHWIFIAVCLVLKSLKN
jgi:catechol-2,3-dioxygenase